VAAVEAHLHAININMSEVGVAPTIYFQYRHVPYAPHAYDDALSCTTSPGRYNHHGQYYWLVHIGYALAGISTL
jgi:hypothetical protein